VILGPASLDHHFRAIHFCQSWSNSRNLERRRPDGHGAIGVAIITTSAMMAALIGDGTALPYHPLWIYLAIGFGSMMISWMNDSGFWVVCKLSGFTERETLTSWSLSLAVISLVGLAEILIASRLLPLTAQ